MFLNSARRWGGNEKWIMMAAHSLATDHEVFLAYRVEEVGNRFHIPRIKISFLNVVDVVTLLQLILYIQKNNIKILVPTKPKDLFLAGIVAKVLRIKVIYRLGIVREMYRPRLDNFLYNTLPDGIIVNAQVTKDTLLKAPFMQSQNIEVIYNGVDFNSIDSQLEDTAFKVEKTRFTVTHIGEISHRKGVGLLIEGFAKFYHRLDKKRVCLVLVGHYNDLAKTLETKISELKLETAVQFTGFQENPYPYLKQSDVFALCSKNEGIPNAMLEAMYLDTVILTFKAGGIEEKIKHLTNGYLVNEETPEAIGNALYQIYSDKKLRTRLTKAAKETVVNSFSLPTMKEEMVSFFERVLSI